MSVKTRLDKLEAIKSNLPISKDLVNSFKCEILGLPCNQDKCPNCHPENCTEIEIEKYRIRISKGLNGE